MGNLRYVVTRRGARQYDEEGGYLQLGDRKFRPGDEVPREIVDAAPHKDHLLDLEMVRSVFDDDGQQAVHDQKRKQQRHQEQEESE